MKEFESTLMTHFHERDIPLEPDEDIFTSGLVDSIGMMQTISFLEKTYSLKIPPVDLVPQNFKTIQVMAAYLESQLAK